MNPAATRDLSLAAFLDRERAAVNAALTRFLDRHLDGVPPRLAEPIRYAVAAGGKRLRPILCVAAFRAAAPSAASADGIYEVAAGLELIHTYSLVHDDLPCMDDDDLRRGRATTHRAYGSRAAVIGGAGLIPLAALALLEGAGRLRLDPAAAGRMVAGVCRAAGACGMVGGQLLDLQAEGMELGLEALERVHASKTGALLAVSARTGGAAAGARGATLAVLEEYGRRVGLAFQIADDVLDVTGTSAELGKTAGKDVAVRKSTYPALLGLEGARARAAAEAEAAVEILARAGLLTAELRGLARYAVERSN